MKPQFHGLDKLQKISVSLMAVLVLVTFLASNLYAVLWQSSSWLVSTVLPAVVVDLTNAERLDNDAQPLVRNTDLDLAAKLKAQHMAKNEYFAHYSPDGVSPWFWFDQVGYTYAHAGENLAIHFTDSDEVVDAWMQSPAHRANIVDAKYSEIGVGTAKGTYDGYETVYVVQLFGTPAVQSKPTALAFAPATAKSNIVEEEAKEPVAPVVEPEVVSDYVLAEEGGADEVIPEALEVNEALIADAGDTEVVEITMTPVIVETESVMFEPELVSETVIEPYYQVNETDDVFIIASETYATSSGLAAAPLDISANSQSPDSPSFVSRIATAPNSLLQVFYVLLASVIIGLLVASIIMEARRFHPTQVAYGFALLFVMGGLWYVHNILTSGAVIA